MLQMYKEEKAARKERILEEARNEISQRFGDNIDLIRTEWEREPGRQKQELLNAFDRAFRIALSLQEEGKLSDACYICLFYLRSGVLLGKDNFMFSVFDERFYKTGWDVDVTWSPDFVMDYWKQDILLLEKKLPVKIMGLKKYELAELKAKLAGDYYKVALEFVLESVEEIFALESFQELKKTEKVQMIYSGIYEPHIVLYEWDHLEE